MAAESPSKYLDPKVLNGISRLEIKARLIVEGFISGLHRSPYHGFSIEFAECLASCGTGPVMMCNDEFYEAVTDQKSDEILDKCK